MNFLVKLRYHLRPFDLLLLDFKIGTRGSQFGWSPVPEVWELTDLNLFKGTLRKYSHPFSREMDGEQLVLRDNMLPASMDLTIGRKERTPEGDGL